MDYKSFLADIESRKIKSLNLIYGREKYLIDFLIKEIKSQFIEEKFETLNYVKMSGEDVVFEKLRNANDTLPFMSEKKMVEVEDWSILRSKKEDISQGEDEKNFIEYLKNLEDNSILLLTLNDEKIDNRKKIIKAIKKYGEVMEVNRLDEKDLKNFIKKRLRGKRLEKNVIDKILEMTGYLEKDSEKNLYDLDNELKKLYSYTEKCEQITIEDVKKTVSISIQSSIFELTDEITSKNTKEAMNILSNLLERGVAIQFILYMVIRQFRMLLSVLAYTEKGYSQKMIKDKVGIRFDFIINKLIIQGKKFNKESLIIIMNKLLDIDRKIKTGSTEESLLLEKFLIEIGFSK